MMAARNPSPDAGDRRVLLVSHNFPPTLGAESLLVRNNAVYLHQQGWRVAVLTAPKRLSRLKWDPGLLLGIPDAIELLRTEDEGVLVRPEMNRLLKVACAILEDRIMPCCRLPWQKEATRLGLGWLGRNRPAVIYSRAPRHVSNMTARRLKLQTGLPWVAHFSDPWLAWTYRGLIHRLVIGVAERQVIRDADAVVFVNQPQADRVMSRYPDEWRGKIKIIPHGFASFRRSLAEPGRGVRRPLRILHAGAFYPVYRTPETLFKALAIMDKRSSLKGRLELECVGEETTWFQSLVDGLGIGHIVKLMDSVPYDECQRMIAAADLLIVVDVTRGLRGVFLPSKLIEYFAFEKPVLGITPPRSAVAQLLEGCGLPWAHQDDLAAIASELERQLTAWESGTFALDPSTKRRMAGYHIDEVNKPLEALFESLLDGRRLIALGHACTQVMISPGV